MVAITRSVSRSIAVVLVLGIAVGVLGSPRLVVAAAAEDDAVDPLFDDVDATDPGFPDPLERVNVRRVLCAGTNDVDRGRRVTANALREARRELAHDER